MALLEILVTRLGPALAKAVLKIVLPESPYSDAAADTVGEMLKKRGEDFTTQRAAERLFDNLADKISDRLESLIEVEFSNLPETDRAAAILAVAELFQRLDVSSVVMNANLNAVTLETLARPLAEPAFATLDPGSRELARFALTECCAYVVATAGKLPNFQVATARELLKRTDEISRSLAEAIDKISAIRTRDDAGDPALAFEVQYRRAVAQRFDRMQMFGVRLVGAGARELEVSVAYVTLTSVRRGDTTTRTVDETLAGQKRVAIRGEAGSGKSTLLQWLAIRAAERSFAGPLAEWNALVPFFLTLRDYAEGNFPLPEAFLPATVPNLAGKAPAGWGHLALERGALLLIDGLDEIPQSRRAELFDWLRDLAQTFPQTCVLLSSRPAALDANVAGGPTASARLKALGFEQIALEPMSLADSTALISQWHQAVGRDFVQAEDLSRLESYERELIKALHERAAIRNLASSPLLCAMICALNWDRRQLLPDDRMELYRLALDMLLIDRDLQRKIGAARLGDLDRDAKQLLLDGVAYWMMRNGATEAAREAVEDQIRRLLPRLSRAPQDPQAILQELLERSGVLRQPQVDVVDFIHRTFLEYMAARAAVAAGDFGLLGEKSPDDSWRETIVFAAGHAQGTQRDELIGRLLRMPRAPLAGRPAEATLTAACCLETTASNLAPHLLAELKECARSLFPPRSTEDARRLAPAAQLDPGLLAGHADGGEDVVSACIRCAAIVGGPAMLDVIADYADAPGERVTREVLDAWFGFDEAAFVERVIRKRPVERFLPGAAAPFDDDTIRCLRLLTLWGFHSREAGVITQKLKEFVTGRQLGIDYVSDRETDPGAVVRKGEAGDRPVRQRTLGMADARLLTQIRSIRGLMLGEVSPGVVRELATLPQLETLGIALNDFSDIDCIAEAARLTSLFLHGGGFQRPERAHETLDLSPLAKLQNLKYLTLSFLNFAACRLPADLTIESLSFNLVPMSVFSELGRLKGLNRLHINLQADENTRIDLSQCPPVHYFSLYSKTQIRLNIPSGLRDLFLMQLPDVRFDDTSRLDTLERLTLADVGSGVLQRCSTRTVTWKQDIARSNGNILSFIRAG
jgi:hypothetical protein